MSSIILGTGASEGIPAPFCDCEICAKARSVGGKDIRTRSDFFIDEENLIDYGPDIVAQCMRNGISLAGLKNIFVTHSHEDHIDIAEMITRISTKEPLKHKVKIYGSQKMLDHISLAFPVYQSRNFEHNSWFYEKYEFIPLNPFETYAIDGISVTPILASHYGYGKDELGFNYIITDKSGKTFLYASDTGWYREETWEFLKSCNIKFDYVVSECTYGNQERTDYEEGHLDIKNLIFALEKHTQNGNIDYNTPIYLTHICHLNTLNYSQMVEFFKNEPWNVIVGYDGMIIE